MEDKNIRSRTHNTTYKDKEAQSFKDNRLKSTSDQLKVGKTYSRVAQNTAEKGGRKQEYYPSDSVSAFLAKSNLKIHSEDKGGHKAKPLSATSTRSKKGKDRKYLKKRNEEGTQKRVEKDKHRTLKHRHRDDLFDKELASTHHKDYNETDQRQQLELERLHQLGASRKHNEEKYKNAHHKGEHTMTPKIYQNDDTIHSTNTKGLRTGYKNDSSPLPNFGSSLKTDHSPYLAKRYDREAQEDNGMNDSLNDRMLSPEKAYEDSHLYKTPVTNNRDKNYKKHLSGTLPSNQKIHALVPRKMSDIEENIDDIEMDDYDGNRARKIREYSFSPTKTPSKLARDELTSKQCTKWKSQTKVVPDHANPYNKKWIESKGLDYFSVKEYRIQKHREVVEPQQYDIENFRMVDQPNCDGIDNKIIIWCTCDADPYNKKYLCKSSRIWLEIIANKHKFNYKEWKSSYENLLKGASQAKQISRDIERTFQKHYAFRYISSIHRLSRVLNALAIYDDKLGYVQGMNFLAGAFLIHCEESVAFWLIVELFESYEMREVYDDGLKGMYRHSAILEKLMEQYLPNVLEHLGTVDVRVEMFMSDWVISFLCSYIPLHRLHMFLTGFFLRRWIAFHAQVLAILDFLQDDILRSNDMPTAINTIKTMKEHRNSFKIDRGSKGNTLNGVAMRNNGVNQSLDVPTLRIEENKDDVLSLSFRKEMEEKQQSTGDEHWDKIDELFKSYLKKITTSDYNKIYSSVKIE